MADQQGGPGAPPGSASGTTASGGPAGPDRGPVRDRRWVRAQDILPSAKVTAASVLLALAIGAVLIAVSTPSVISSGGYFLADPGATFAAVGNAIGSSYWALLQGCVGSWNAVANTLVNAAPLICAGLGVTLAFRAGLFNIGAQGQMLLGAAFCGLLGFHFHLPVGIHILAALMGGLVGGAVFGAVAGVLKARTGAHEVIVTIMMNYVASAILDWLLGLRPFQQSGSNNKISPAVDSNAAFPQIAGVHIGVILAFVAAIAVWWLLNRTTLGFKMRAVGANPAAARTAGMSVAYAYTMAMLIAGLLAGLAGAEQMQGNQVQLSDSFGGTVGFDAITVSLLGRASPLGTVLAGLLFGALDAGGTQMQAIAGTSVSLVEIIQALIVIFVAAPMLVKVIFRFRKVGGEGAMMAKGWSS
ncbi:MAG TPA: ABC transporter permease [Nocardioidaceae bacterium]|nr:ABC transporter permease [Nocardioidaceae bacterium]